MFPDEPWKAYVGTFLFFITGIVVGWVGCLYRCGTGRECFDPEHSVIQENREEN